MLPFSAEVYLAVLAYHNAAVWPVLGAAPVLAVAALSWSHRRPRAGGRALLLVLAAGWLWTGAVWHLTYMAPLHYVGPLYAALFLTQGAVLLAWSLWPRRWGLPDPRRGGWRGMAGAALVVLALAGVPLLPLLTGAPAESAQVFGATPLPTVLLTLAALLLVPGRAPVAPAVLPLAWCVIGGGTAWLLGWWWETALLAVAAGAVVGAWSTKG